MLGYVDGRQDIDLFGITPGGGADLAGITSRLPPDAAGSAVLDRQGRAIGLLTQPSATGTRAVGLDVLREFKSGSRRVDFAPRPADCTEAKGPQAPVVPVLDGPNGELAEEAQRLLGDYLTALNRHDEQRVRDLFTGHLEEDDSQSIANLTKRYRMQYTFGPVIRNVQEEDNGARVQMTHTALKQPSSDTGNLLLPALRHRLRPRPGRRRAADRQCRAGPDQRAVVAPVHHRLSPTVPRPGPRTVPTDPVASGPAGTARCSESAEPNRPDC